MIDLDAAIRLRAEGKLEESNAILCRLALENPDDLPKIIKDMARPSDMVVCLGAGTVTNWAHALPGQLAELYGEPVSGGAQ